MSVIPPSPGRNVVNEVLLGKETADNRLRPYELSKYKKYTPERVGMGRYANENSPAKAFSQFEIASYWDSTTRIQPRGLVYSLHHSAIAVTSHLGVEVLNCQIKKYGILAKIDKLNARQIFPLYGILL